MTKTIAEESREFAEEIATNANFNCSGYSRNPLVGSNFILNNLHGKEVKLWKTPIAEVETFTDKGNKQAVFNIFEEKRVLTKTTKETMYTSHLEEYLSLSEVDFKKKINSLWIHHNPITTFTPGAKSTSSVSLTKEELKAKVKRSESRYDYVLVPVNHKVVVPKTELTVLAGIDETQHFICALSEKATSVAHAHKLLRPQGLKGSTKRQGEWFFEPCFIKNCRELDQRLMSDLTGPKYKRTINVLLERDSTHEAQLLVRIGNETFVRGEINDHRKGRHHPLVLEDWHKVVRNNEVVIPFEEQLRGRARYWD